VNKYSVSQFIADYKMVLDREMHYAHMIPTWVYPFLVIPEVWFWVWVWKRHKRKSDFRH
jgi:hypothetical protein